MRRGKVVAYVVGSSAQEATVARVSGTGPSGYKVLDLETSKGVQEMVPHENDKGKGGYWTLDMPKRRKR